ncbi:MAG: AAA family ATPase [Candidatus Aminicenantes bacterium]|nr:AAA family ATPase [Candidatus Aminicenantes bacterium]
MIRGVFIAGSGKDAGKTTLCLGLAKAFAARVDGGVSFFKPLGQKTTVVDGESVGQDSWFIAKALGLSFSQKESTPMLASRGAAERYVRTGEPRGMPSAVKRSFADFQRNSGIVLVEGTGHPGVGSVFDLGNARVASMLGIPVILVLDGGVGSTIDSFCLCQALFNNHGVPLLGVVINRVLPAKMEAVAPVLRLWFSGRGIPVFGILPFEERIARPSIATITREIGAAPLFGSVASPGGGSGFIVAFDSSEEVLKKMEAEAGKALLVSHTRPDVLDAVIVSRLSGGACPPAVVVCGGSPDHRRQAACGAAGIPLYFTENSLEGSALKLSRNLFKIEPDEGEKIASIIQMVTREVEAESILRALEDLGGSSRRPSGRGILGFLKRLFRRKPAPSFPES